MIRRWLSHSPSAIVIQTLTLVVTIMWSNIPIHAASLVDVYRIALQRDGHWLAQQAQVKADQTQQNQAEASLLPNLSANGFYSKERYDGSLTGIGFNDNFTADCNFNPSLFDPGCLIESTSNRNTVENYNRHGFGVQLNQPLLRVDRWHRYRSAMALSQQRQLDLNHYHQELLHRVTQIYLGTLNAEEDLRYARAEHMATMHQFNDIRRQYQLGLAGETAVFEVTAAKDVTAASVTTARNDYQNAREDLIAITGVSDIQANPLPQHLPMELPQPQIVDGWINQAQASNPKIKSAFVAIRAAKQRQQEAIAGHAPTVDFVASYRKNNTGGGFVPSSNTTSYGVVFNVPIYEGGGRSARSHQAELQWRAAIAQHQAVADQTKAQVNKSFRNVLTAIAQAKAQESAIKSSQLALQSIEKGYQHSTRSVLEVVDARRAVFKAKKQHAQSRYQYIYATIDLKRAAGILNQSDIQIIDSWLTLDDLTPNTLPYDTLFPLDPPRIEGEPMPTLPLENGPAPRLPTDLPRPAKSNPPPQKTITTPPNTSPTPQKPIQNPEKREAQSLYEAIMG